MFSNGEAVRRVGEAKYLGCVLNENANYTREATGRWVGSFKVSQRLNLFGRGSNCSVGFKVRVVDAVVRSKL